MERVEQRRGKARKLLDQSREQLRQWLVAIPDLTLDQLQQNLHEQCGVKISRAQVASALKQMGLRLKKSHSTPPSAIGKKTVVGVKSLSNVSARSRRKN
jgi:transposase